MKNIDIHGMTNMELIRGGIAEWYWATDYIHGDLYEAEELFRQGHLVRSNRLYLIHYPDGMIYEPVHSADGQYLIQLAIIGAGPAGYEAAVFAAKQGLKTALIERHTSV